MTQDPHRSQDLRDVLKEENVEVHFQPIISIPEKAVIGFEGLSRGVVMPSGRLVPPAVLLKNAVEENLTFELDALFRRKVFQYFQEHMSRDPRVILTINLESQVAGETGPQALSPSTFLQLARQHHMDPRRIVIEIVESRAKSPSTLEHFIKVQREHGFLIALDDVGSGHSNLDRIARFKPDLIKIDRSLIVEVHREYHKQEVFRSLVNLSRQIGALVLAEGVETEEECLQSMELGADLLQGYYFSKPQKARKEGFEIRQSLIDDVGRKFHSRLISSLREQRGRQVRSEARLFDLKGGLDGAKPMTFDAHLDRMIEGHPDVEALYVLDEAGMQVTRSVCAARVSKDPVRAFCLPRGRGSDHALRDYYYRLAQGDPRTATFVSEPYVSLTTGNPCVTMSVIFKCAYGRNYFLCADMRPGCL